MNGAGTVILSASNAYSGGTIINSGTVSLQAPAAAGSGDIVFGYGATATLIVGKGDVPSNTIDFFLPGEAIDLRGIGTATSAALGSGNVLTVTSGTRSIRLQLDPGQIFTGETFAVKTDNAGGTLVTAVTTGNDHPPFISGSAVNGNDHTAFSPLAGVTIADLDSGQTETAKLTLSSTANGKLSHLGGGTFNAKTRIYTVTGTAAAVTVAIQGLVFTPTVNQVSPGSSVQTGFDLNVTDGTMTADTPYSVSVTALNDAPTITNSGTSQIYGYWNVPIDVFSGVTIADPDVGAAETVTLSLSSYFSGDQGTLTLANPVQGISLTQTSPGVYTLTTGSPQAVTAALDAVQYTPTTGNPSLGFTIGNIGMAVSDGIAPTVTGPGITVYAGLPIATGTVANQTVLDTATIQPFSTVQITDSAPFTTVTVTIELTDPNYTPTDAQGTLAGAGLSKAGVGIYTLPMDDFASVSSELDALVFHPAQVSAGQSVTTDFVLEMFDGATTHSDYTTSVITTAPAAATVSSAALAQPGIAFLAGGEAGAQAWSDGKTDLTASAGWDWRSELPGSASLPASPSASLTSSLDAANGAGAYDGDTVPSFWLLQHGGGGGEGTGTTS
jgi:autotransporter-associated beta strand protein